LNDLWCRSERIKEEINLIDDELNRILNHTKDDIDILANAEFLPDFETDEPLSYEYARNKEIEKLKKSFEDNLELRRKWDNCNKYNTS